MFRAEAKELLTNEILFEGAHAFFIAPDSLELVGGFENIIYSGNRDNHPVILRVTHHRHRSSDQLAFELHWLNYLKEQRANVCGPYPSRSGKLVESFLCGDTWLHFSCFTKAPGKHTTTREELYNTRLFQAWGRATGKLHRLTGTYTSPQELPRRGDNVDIFYETLIPYLPADAALHQKMDELANSIRTLPQTPGWYGLIHSDIHPANFCYDGKDLYIFDFDDACYFQLASDGAMALYYSIWGSRLEGQERDKFGHRFLKYWLMGYLEEHIMTLAQLQTFPQLLLFRDCELLAVLRDEFDLANLNADEEALHNHMTARIMDGRPCVKLDYEQIWREVTEN